MSPGITTRTAAVVGAGAGAGAPAVTLGDYVRDDFGLVWVGSGASPAAGTLVTITFGAIYTGPMYPRTPHIFPFFLFPDDTTAAAGIYVVNASPSGFAFRARSAITASLSNNSDGQHASTSLGLGWRLDVL